MDWKLLSQHLLSNYRAQGISVGVSFEHLLKVPEGKFTASCCRNALDVIRRDLQNQCQRLKSFSSFVRESY